VSSTISSQAVVPTISSKVAGPLGVLHLPRLWQKLTLSGAGKLADGYDFCGTGFDQMTVSALGLNRDEVIRYVSQEKPTYIKFEAWVKSQPGVKLARETIDAHNSAVLGFIHSDDTRKSVLSEVGLPDGNPRDAASLNDLDDWNAFYHSVVR
jgi:hypothetical protein